MFNSVNFYYAEDKFTPFFNVRNENFPACIFLISIYKNRILLLYYCINL